MIHHPTIAKVFLITRNFLFVQKVCRFFLIKKPILTTKLLCTKIIFSFCELLTIIPNVNILYFKPYSNNSSKTKKKYSILKKKNPTNSQSTSSHIFLVIIVRTSNNQSINLIKKTIRRIIFYKIKSISF